MNFNIFLLYTSAYLCIYTFPLLTSENIHHINRQSIIHAQFVEPVTPIIYAIEIAPENAQRRPTAQLVYPREPIQPDSNCTVATQLAWMCIFDTLHPHLCCYDFFNTAFADVENEIIYRQDGQMIITRDILLFERFNHAQPPISQQTKELHSYTHMMCAATCCIAVFAGIAMATT